MGMVSEFKEFIARGNVVDLAVGVVIGAAFGKIVTALVDGIVMPLVGVLLNLPRGAFGVLLASVAIGTPALSLIGAIGAALTAGVRRGGVLVPLLVLPLYIPTLIFGVAATAAAGEGLPASEPLMLLGAMTLMALVLAPVAAAAALRLALE